MSILLVLAGHLLPLGPKPWAMNFAVASAGLGAFFSLSGFLIVSNLLAGQPVGDFCARRFVRIVPAAYVFIAVAAIVLSLDGGQVAEYLLFVANDTRRPLTFGVAQLWSICVEVHFYLLMALIALVARRHLAAICVGVFLMLFATKCFGWIGTTIETHERIDELFGGAVAGVIFNRYRVRAFPAYALPPIALFALCAFHESFRPLWPARGILTPAALLCAISIYESRPVAGWLRYVGTISYSLYLWHQLLATGWFASADKLVLYTLKRPLTFAASFLIAHVSTFAIERPLLRRFRGEHARALRPLAGGEPAHV